MKLNIKQFGLSVMALSMVTACGNLSKISADGATDDPVWPKIERAGVNYSGSQAGTWPNWDNVRQVEAGMNKDQLYYLLGRPHFSEGMFNVREWDYVFNYRENGEQKVCQYKVLFDKDMNVAQQWWLPNGCNGLVPYELNTDVLFEFNKDEFTADGLAKIKALAEEFTRIEAQSVHIEGHTDRLGGEAYNLALSQQRAKKVQAELVASGVNIPMTTSGVGKAKQVVACAGMSGQAERDCLLPNRRVVITTTGSKVQKENAGNEGPAGVKHYQQDPNKTSWN